MESLVELGKRLFRSYIEHKSEALVDAIEQGMQTGMFEWDVCACEPTSVRSYVQDIILSLVAVHCEVSASLSLYLVTKWPPLVAVCVHMLTVEPPLPAACLRLCDSVWDVNL